MPWSAGFQTAIQGPAQVRPIVGREGGVGVGLQRHSQTTHRRPEPGSHAAEI